jgi:hypothetical protein
MSCRRTLHDLAAAAVLFGALIVCPAVGSAQGRPDCAAVLRKLHETTAHNGAHLPDAAKVANRLGVEPEWVERCAASYGRRVKMREEKPKEDREGTALVILEDQEYEEISREEKETAGDKYFTVIEEDEANRKRLRHFDADSSAEWDPYVTHEWEPNLGHAWQPYLLDDDHPNEVP